MTTCKAWLLECGSSLSIAVGDHELAEFVQQQGFQLVPGAPEYCSGVIVWHGNIVPVMDLAALYDPQAASGVNYNMLSVLKYQTEPNTPIQHLAVRVSGSPEKILVDDQHACECPEYLNSSVFGPVSLACFSHNEIPVMILDIARLCSAEFREIASAA